MNRIVINMDPQGLFTVYSDEPVEFFVVCDHTPNDRVYQMEVDTGVEKVQEQLGAGDGRSDDTSGRQGDYAKGGLYRWA